MTPPTSGSSASTFAALGIAPKLVDALSRLKVVEPTPIQQRAIPVAITGKDVLGIAQTGTGKTFAFGLPMIQRLAKNNGRGLVVLPTRELALQVDAAFRSIAKDIGLRTAVCIGGESQHKQVQDLRKKPHVIIATPGRLLDHMQQKNVSLHDVKILVLDEADRMFDMGFAPQLNKILAAVPKERQTMLFSATMPAEILHLATANMHLPLRIEVAPAGSTVDRIEQEMIIVSKMKKTEQLKKTIQETKGTVLVFSRTKHGAKRITQDLRDANITAAEIHSNRSLAQRTAALSGFKTGRFRVLVATDIAARGIDVSGIALVINFDLPDNPEDYVHRIGRTGRAGMSGKAISFATPDQGTDIRRIERVIQKNLPLVELDKLIPTSGFGTGPRHGRGGGSRGGFGGARRSGGFRRGGSSGRSGGHRSGGSSTGGRGGYNRRGGR